MRYVLPPMHTLRALEAVSRWRSFASAADELHLTASAVSHQIRALESFYGSKLLQRNHHDVTMTPAGEQLLGVVQELLQRLSEVGESLRRRDTRRLSITAPPSLVSRWLMPRLGGFLGRHPDIDFRLHATTQLLDLDAGQADFAIRYGAGAWPDTRSEKILEERLFPVASPRYLSRVAKRSGLRGLTLLRDDFHGWEPWSAATGQSLDGSIHGATFSDSALLLQAAEEGHGVALGRSTLAEGALASGCLVRVGKGETMSQHAYYLIASSRRTDTAPAQAFRQWLLDPASA
ncbi:MAG TPA: LysR substrate-binding domain-containing protein [Dyella sp.]|uniref:LysR substrate-binding domain-containing protein n=1 Tax=Dyella sp. TaxID=1869338 RepID=UPI002D771421|nr:LysR substrate-binding domain-containing protein [Dyella sp.]HET6553119.1 LysR substrate-binding domain-containing protein [Dyella sp.]